MTDIINKIMNSYDGTPSRKSDKCCVFSGVVEDEMKKISMLQSNYCNTKNVSVNSSSSR